MEISESTIRRWRYDRAIQDVLLELFKGTQDGRHATISWQLLAYVHRRRPLLRWSPWLGRLGFAGLTVALPTRYMVLLHPEHVHPTPDGAAIIAHELGHALWNSHGFDSSEEEYYCDRIAGRAYEEMLQAAGMPPAESARLARSRFPALDQSAAAWIARRRAQLRRHLLKPWTWFDSSRAADLASNLILGPWVNLGVWGHPVWQTRRDLGK